MEEKRGISDIITVAVVNFRADFGDKKSNLSRIRDFSIAAAKRGANLIVFPEMSLTGCDYLCSKTISRAEKEAIAETADGPSAKILEATAKEHGIYIVFGMPEKSTDDPHILYNSALVLGPDGPVGCYRKIHPFGVENEWCVKGEAPLLFQTPWGPVGVGICYDTYHFPELMRYYTWQGARLYLNATAVEQMVRFDQSRQAFLDSYMPHLTSGVMSNNIFLASSNQAGYDKTNYFAGGSVILGPKTSGLKLIGYHRYGGDENDDQVGIHLATLDLSLAERRRFKPNPRTGTPDFRPEIYRKLYEFPVIK